MPMVAKAQGHQIDPPLYTRAELTLLRRNVLLYARSFRPGSERNQHRQIGQSLRVLFRNSKWLDQHTVEGSREIGHVAVDRE
jgi:hypothetical protein